jgi:hypothetical protein
MSIDELVNAAATFYSLNALSSTTIPVINIKL